MSSIYYNLILFILVLLGLIRFHKNKNATTDALIFCFVFCILFAFYFFRFDVGPDYSNYVNAYYNFSKYNIPANADYYLFKKLSIAFGSVDNGYLYVLQIYASILLIALFLVLDKRPTPFLLGLIVFVCMGFMLDSFDRVRQATAIGVFLYSIKYIKEDKLFKYLLSIMFASLFHLSALLLLPCFYICKIKIDRVICLLVITFFLVVNFLFGYDFLWDLIYNYSFFYGSEYKDTEYAVSGGFGSGLGFLYNVLFFSLVLFYSKCHVYRMSLFFGIVIYIVAGGNLNIMRFSEYFLIVSILCVSDVFRAGRAFGLIVVFSLVLFYQKDIQRNYFEYKTIFSKEYDVQIFEYRKY